MAKDHWIVRMNHRNRTAAFLSGLFCISLHISDLSVHPALWGALLIQFLLVPHILYLRARQSEDQLEAELNNTLIDACAFGFWSGLLGFPIWISFIFLVGAFVNPTAFRGITGCIRGLTCYAVAGAVGYAIAGFEFRPDTSLGVSLLAISTVTIYLLTVALGVYRRSLSLHRAKQTLKDKELNLQRQLTEITQLQHQLKEQATKDPLTGLFNRRYLETTLERALATHDRSGTAVSVVLIDIDHFKQINDQHGHPAGDQVLQKLAALMRQIVRANDVVARMGGEEFIVLIEGGRAQDAFESAERIRATWEGISHDLQGVSIQSTLSAGVANLLPGESISSLIRRADIALYEAKSAGRNQVKSAVPDAIAGPA